MTGQADKRPPPLVVPLLHTALGHPFETLAIDVRQDRVRRVDPADRITILGNGHEIACDRLLIATGAHPVEPPIEGIDSEGVENCRTLADARRILAGARPGSRVVTHGAGRAADETVESVRQEIATFLSSKPEEIIWTSGATESINLALKGAALARRDRGDHIVVSPLREHLAQGDEVRVSYIPSFQTSDYSEYFSINALLHQQLRKPLHQWTQTMLRPVRDVLIQHQPLPEQ